MKIVIRFSPVGCTSAAALAAVLLTGCVDETPSSLEVASDAPALGAQTPAQPASTPEMVIEPRFEIDLEIDGPLKPGHPIHLTVRGGARFATQDAEVRLILPEVAAAERSSWELIEIPVGEDLPPHLRIRKGFAAGETFRERATVTIPEPGYYYVLATVLQHSDGQNGITSGVSRR